jgi:bacterioferritin-associated ferredoxin
VIVCLCRGVSDGALHDAVAAGAGSLPELAMACRGAGTDCGSCQWMLAALLDAEGPGVRCALASSS